MSRKTLCSNPTDTEKSVKQDTLPTAPKDSQLESSSKTASSTNMTVPVPTAPGSCPANNSCLLKTAIAEVRAAFNYRKAQILFDEDAQWLFMTQ